MGWEEEITNEQHLPGNLRSQIPCVVQKYRAPVKLSECPVTLSAMINCRVSEDGWGGSSALWTAPGHRGSSGFSVPPLFYLILGTGARASCIYIPSL